MSIYISIGNKVRHKHGHDEVKQEYSKEAKFSSDTRPGYNYRQIGNYSWNTFINVLSLHQFQEKTWLEGDGGCFPLKKSHLNLVNKAIKCYQNLLECGLKDENNNLDRALWLQFWIKHALGTVQYPSIEYR